MRLVPLFEGELRFDEATEVGFASFGESGDICGYVQGDGDITGERLRGTIRWTNFPRRRDDGTWLPDFRGVISTEDGTDILVSLQGYNWQVGEEVPDTTRSLAPVPLDAMGDHRAALAVLTLAASDENYRWVNGLFGIIEADIRPLAEPERWRVRAFECVNEISDEN